MKGLDSPVLIALLRGDSAVRPLLDSISRDEVGTTEWDLLEVERAARADPSPGRQRRLLSVERLRRAVTVLPLDERAARLASPRVTAKDGTIQLATIWKLAALEAAGADEWYTVRGRASGRPRGRVKVKHLPLRTSQTR